MTSNVDSLRAALTLTGSQRVLRSRLAALNGNLERMYIGGLTVLQDETNPDRFALAAHALRELLEKLPAHFDVPQKKSKERINDKLINLAQQWGHARKSGCHKDGTWDGAIDKRLRSFLEHVKSFFDWHERHHPSRNAEAADALRRLDATGRRLPPPLENLNLKFLEEIRSFFVKVSHHGCVVEFAEFAHWLDALERFLLDRLSPRTFDDHEELDRLMSEGANA